MTGQEYAFAVMAAVGSVSAVATVTARNVVHAALYLVVTLSSVGAVYLLLGAEFVKRVRVAIGPDHRMFDILNPAAIGVGARFQEIIVFLIVEPNGLARLWAIGKEKLRLWPFPH